MKTIILFNVHCCRHFKLLLKLPSTAKIHQILTQGNTNIFISRNFFQRRKNIHCVYIFILYMHLGKKNPLRLKKQSQVFPGGREYHKYLLVHLFVLQIVTICYEPDIQQ